MSSDQKIFVSPFKGGSTSVALALESLGFKRAKYEIDKRFGDALLPSIPLTSLDIHMIRKINTLVDLYDRLQDVPYHVVENIKFELVEKLNACAEGFNVFDDYPLGHDIIHPFVRKIVFPKSKFIFVERPMDEYLKSVRNHVLNPKYRHFYRNSKRLFCDTNIGYDRAILNYKKWKSTYLSLKEYSPEDVLIMDLEDGWTPLVCFLDIEMPKKDFPWKNKSKKEVNCIDFCKHELKYFEEFDSHYCFECSKWMEETCENKCSICSGRPKAPKVN